MEGVGGVFGLVSKLLEFFQQKAYVYVDVVFSDENPYKLTVVNNSKFDVFLNEMKAEPHGFKVAEKGFDILTGGLFRDKVMKPGQKIVFPFSSKDIGTQSVKIFTIRYCTILKGKKVPRYEQSCEFLFERDTYSVHVSSSATIPVEWTSNESNKRV